MSAAYDPKAVLARAGIRPTPNRVLALGCMAQASGAMSAPDILARMRRVRPVNKVTLYRILDLLVEAGVALRHSGGDRSFRYCLGAAGGAASHCHFFCTRCGQVECVDPARARIDLAALNQALPQQVDAVEVRLDGICAHCRNQH